jgi:prevent-host-death family protein
MRSLSTAEAKAQFADCLRKAEAGQPTVITRHGHAVAALVDAETAAQCARLSAAGPSQGLAGLKGGWKGSDDLVRLIGQGRRTRPRRRA